MALGLAWAEEPPAKTKPLFDGKTFASWDGDRKKTWRIKDGALVGGLDLIAALRRRCMPAR